MQEGKLGLREGMQPNQSDPWGKILTSDGDTATPDKAQPLFDCFTAEVALGRVFKCTESLNILIHMLHIQPDWAGKDLPGRMGESVQIQMCKDCGDLPKKLL